MPGKESPVGLNLQLKQVYDALPNIPVEEVYFTKEKEYDPLLLAKAQRLVSRAPITVHFRKFIVDRFAICIGMRSRTEDFYFLDYDDPTSGGIYDQERAAYLERIAIAKQAAEYLSIQRVIDRTLEGLGQFTSARSQKNREGFQTELRQWKEAYKSHYNIDLDT